MEHGPHPEHVEWKAPRVEVVTRANPRHPHRNEDASFVSSDHLVMGVCDGVGGVPGGDIASKLAAQTLLEKMQPLTKTATRDEIMTEMYDAFKEAHARILYEQTHDVLHQAMCATALVVRPYYANSMRRAVIGHMGDSRAYVRHADTRLATLTIDDDYFLRMFATQHGTFNEDLARQMQETIENATYGSNFSFAENAVFTGKLGRERNGPSQLLGYTSYKSPHVADYAFPEGSKLLLASDGLQNLTRDEMAAIWNAHATDPAKAAQLLVINAYERSLQKGFRSSPDDITAMIVE